jgi:polyether ionophore transport system permease protein
VNSLVGTGSLVRLVLRRERVRLPIWLLVLAVVPIATASSFNQLYPNAQAREAFARSIADTPGIAALSGPSFALDTIGGETMWKGGAVTAVLIGLITVFTVVRHTRADEEAGRLELIGSAAVGRRAALTATLIVTFFAGIVLALLLALGMISQGPPAAGSFAMGIGLGAQVWLFATVAAVAAQLTESSSAANGLGSTVVGAAYLLRAAGDGAGPGGPGWLSWVSPIGWAQQLRPYAGERWWVLVLLLGLPVVLLVISYALVSRRDVGAGLVRPRPGPAQAGPGLLGTIGLAWRLNKASLLGWIVGLAVLGAAMGSLANGVVNVLNTNPELVRAVRTIGGQRSLVDTFVATVLDLVGLAVSVYAVRATLRLRTEETGQRVEPLLAASVGRLRLAASHLAFALVGSAVLLAVTGVVTGIAVGTSTDGVGTEVPRLLGAAMIQLPAVWVLAGIATALFGLLPKLTSLAWAAIVAFLLLGQLGSLFRLSQWALDLSPFTHLPKLPGGTVTAMPG